MEKNDLNLKLDTDPREATSSLRLSEVIPESDESFDVSNEETPRMLATPTRRPTRRPTPRPATSCRMHRYTLANIAQNNDASKCWMSLYGVVYDLTAYVGKHPGGAIILDQCGTDATQNFDRQHGVSLLTKKGFASSIIGRLGSSRGVQTVACSSVKLVAVTGARRLSEDIPENDESFDVSNEEIPRMLASPTRRPTRRPTPRPATSCRMHRYTLANIAQNNDASKCWMSLYGVVYDLTAYVGKHPGGAIILDQCGTDATQNFDRQHGVSLLTKKGFASSIIGRLGSSRGVQTVACSSVKLVAVTGARRLD